MHESLDSVLTNEKQETIEATKKSITLKIPLEQQGQKDNQQQCPSPSEPYYTMSQMKRNGDYQQACSQQTIKGS